mgnify:FL=1
MKPELLRWARERAGLPQEDLARKVGSKETPAPVAQWEQTGEIPLNKLEQIAQRTHAPFAVLFLDQPPEEKLPIQDFRNNRGHRPSLGLLQSIYDAQLRQTWLSTHLQSEGQAPLVFVGSATVETSPEAIGQKIRESLAIDTFERSRQPDIEKAVLWMMDRLNDAGILTQRSGIVGQNTRRKLDPDEFKGFALADPWAPLIFINGRDWPASQMFTIGHELAHIWLGRSALPDGAWFERAEDPAENWCNRVAAEVLMPTDEIKVMWRAGEEPRAMARSLSKHFKMSTLALLVRFRALGLITENAFKAARELDEKDFRESEHPRPKSTGGDFYATAKSRLGKRFIQEVLVSTLEGKTLYSEAFELLGTRKTSVFYGLRDKYLPGGAP